MVWLVYFVVLLLVLLICFLGFVLMFCVLVWGFGILVVSGLSAYEGLCSGFEFAVVGIGCVFTVVVLVGCWFDWGLGFDWWLGFMLLLLFDFVVICVW